MDEECIVFGCTNKKSEGTFVGDICGPCYKIITEGDLNQPSDNFIHQLAQEHKKVGKEINEMIRRLNRFIDEKYTFL